MDLPTPATMGPLTASGLLRGALWISDYFPRPHDPTAGTWALESAVALQRAGLPVAVLAPTPWIPWPLARTAELQAWSRTPARWEPSGVPAYYPRCPHYPRRWVNERVYTRWPALEGRLLWPWCRAAAERIMAARPFDVVHANFVLPAGALGARLKRVYGTPLVVHERSVQRLASACRHPARGRAYRRVLRAADLVITENQRMAAELRTLEPRIRALEVRKQPGLVPDETDVHRRPRPAALADHLMVLSVGALSERKGHATLVHAVAALHPEFPQLRCRIIGEGPERGRLTSLIATLGLGSVVELRGRRPHAEVLGDMSWCDVFALPSWGEAGGTVYGEAMQFGVPVVACVGEGIAEVVEDGVQGRLVPPRNAEALAEALRGLLANPGLRHRMGAEARTLAARTLSYPALATELIAVYQSLVNRARRS